MEDKTQKLYQTLYDRGLYTKTYDDFTTQFSDEVKKEKLFNSLNQQGLYTKTYEDFNSQFFGKKKVPTEDFGLPSFDIPSKIGQEVSKKPLDEFTTPQQPLPSAEKPKPAEAKKEPSTYRDTLPRDLTLSSITKADEDRASFIDSEAKKIEEDAVSRLKEEFEQLSETYKGDELEAEKNKLIDKRTAGVEKAIENKYKDANYQFIKDDVKDISAQIDQIVNSGLNHDEKEAKIDELRNSIISEIPIGTEGLQQEIQDQVGGELNKLIADVSSASPLGEQFILKKTASGALTKISEAQSKLREDYLSKFDYPKTSPMGGGYIWDSKEQAEAFLKFRDDDEKLSVAQSYLERALNVPETKDGAGKKAFQNELHNILSAGFSGMVETIATAKGASEQAKGVKNEANDAILDAYGILQSVSQIASEGVKQYRRRSSIAGSIAYMEQFLLTGGIGTGASATAVNVGKSIMSKGIKGRIAQQVIKRGVVPAVEGAISMVGRVPLSPATYGNIARESIGDLKLEDGKFVVDPEKMPKISEAIASGTYESAKEIFSESLGGMVDIKLPRVLNRVITPEVKKFFKMAGMNNPHGEYYEELVSQALGGENPFEPQFLTDLLFTIPAITGGFSALTIPSVAVNMKIRADNKAVVDKFGKDNISDLRDLVEIGDEMGVVSKLQNLAQNPDVTQKDLGNLLKYAGSLVQENTVTEMTKPTTPDKGTAVTEVGALEVPQEVADQKTEEVKPQKAPYVEINSENISEIENNELSSLREQGATEVEIAEVQQNLDLIKESINERERNQLAVPAEDRTGEISVIRPEEIAGDEGALGGIFRGRRDRNRGEGRITPEEQVKNTLAPNGEKSNLPTDIHSYVRTPEFAQKFGNWQEGEGSLVLDRNGEPLLVYSGKGKYHVRGIDPARTQQKILFFTGDRMLAKDYAQFRGKQPTIYRGFVRIADTDLQEGSQINNLHDGQQEFIITKKEQFIPIGVEEIGKKPKAEPAQSKDSTKPLVTDKKVESLPSYLTEEQAIRVLEKLGLDKESGFADFPTNIDAIYNPEFKDLPIIKAIKDEIGKKRPVESKKVEEVPQESVQKPAEPTYGTKKTLPKNTAKRFDEVTLKPNAKESIPNIPRTEVQTLADGSRVMEVDGAFIRDNIHADFTMGGNEGAYPSYVPQGEIWIDKDMNPKDKEATILHEATEKRLMLEDGLTYEDAHDKANKVESKFRETGEKPAEITEPKEAITAPITEDQGKVPPTPQKPVKEAEMPPKGQKPLGAQERALRKSETEEQQVVSDLIDENKEFYTVLEGDDAVKNANTFIEERGIEGAAMELMNPTRDPNEYPTRQVARLVLIDHFSRILGSNQSTKAERDKAYNVINKLQEVLSKEANKTGQGNAHLSLWKVFQPSGLLVFTKRKIDEFNEKKLSQKYKGSEKSIGQLIDDLYDNLSEANKEIIDSILEGQDVSLQLDKADSKKPIVPPKKKTVPKERIKQEQDYRKNLIEQYRKGNKGITLSANMPLSVEQIELGGNLIASYTREGYYRLIDIVDKLKKDLSLAGIRVKDDHIDTILKQKKEGNKTYRSWIIEQEAQVGLKEEMKSARIRIQDVVKKHWTVRDELRRTLAQKLTEDALLTPEEAKNLEKIILEQYQDMIQKRLSEMKELTAVLGKERIPMPKQKKSTMDKMFEMINLGALDEKLFRELFADKFGLASEITEEQAAQIMRLANAVQQMTNKGYFYRDAVIELGKYIYEIQPTTRMREIAETWIALAYAHTLSGIPTSILNLFSSGSNMVLQPFRNLGNFTKYAQAIRDYKKTGKPISGTIYNPLGQMFWVPIFRGATVGAVDATEVLINGDIGSKYVEEIATNGQFKVGQLDRNKYGKGKRFKPIPIKVGKKTIDLNIQNLDKYVSRNLAAQDRLMFNTFFEVEILAIIRENLSLQGLSGKELVDKTMEIYMGKNVDKSVLVQQIEAEAALYKELTGKDTNQRQKLIRMRELMLKQLPFTEEQKRESEAIARSNVFTDDRGGMVATLAVAIGRIANSHPITGLALKPFVMFTKVVGNVTEYMLDYTPFYGFMRAHGMGLSAIKKAYDPTYTTSQMGKRGSRAYMEQMGRAWLGTETFIILGMMLIGNDDDDFIDVSGGYDREELKNKPGRTNVMPSHSIRFGDFKMSYLNIPGLAIPLGLIGNINDGLKMGMSEDELEGRLTASLLQEAVLQTITMTKDMSFVTQGMAFIQMISDFANMSGNALSKAGKTMLKSYLGFLGRPLPQNHAIVQQTWKFFDPTSYSQSDIKGILAYSAGLQHFVGTPTVDQLGDIRETYPGESLMPYTHWMKIKGTDDRWKFLVKYNSIPTRAQNDATVIETVDGVHKRKLEPQELYDYSRLAGQYFSSDLRKYMQDEDKIDSRFKDREVTFNSKGEEVILTGVQQDIAKMWTKAKSSAKTNLFRWYDIKKDHPADWKKMVDLQAVPHPESSVEIEIDDNKVRLTQDQVSEFNDIAMEYYRQYVMEYLNNKDVVDTDKKEIDEDTKDTYFNKEIKKEWSAAKADARLDMEDKLTEQK